MRRPSALLAAVALGWAALLGGAAPAAAAEPFVVDPPGTPQSVTVTDGPGDGRTFELEIDLYVPSGAGRYPAVVMTNGFGLSKDAAEVRSMASFLARNGYVVLAYTAAGFGGSGGCISLQSADFDARSTSQLIDQVLEPRDDVLRDDKGLVVGTVGGSYGGGGQLVLAGVDGRIRAAAPGRTWNLLRYSLNPNNRVAPGDPTGFSHELNDQGVFKYQWSSLFFASGNAQPVGGAPPSGGPKGGCLQDPYRSSTTSVPLPALPAPFPAGGPVPCLGFIGAVCETFARVFGTGETTEVDRTLLDRASADVFLDPARAAAAGGSAVRIPVLLVQGLSDTLFNVNDALATYTDLRRAGVPVELVWNSGGHGGYDSLPGECEVYGGGVGTGPPEFGGLENCYLTARTLDFFDRQLKGRAGTAPGFSWFQEWVPGPATQQYGSAPSYPAMPSTTFALSGDALVPPGGALAPGSVRLVNPPLGQPSSYTETSNFTGPGSTPRDPRPPYDVPGQFAAFTTPPFAADTVSVGVPRARLLLSHTAPTDLVLFAKLFDVAPDGTATLIHRQVAPVRVPAASVGEPVDVALVGHAVRFAAGHSARLVLTTTDAAYRNNPVPDVVTLATGTGSSLSLPLSAGAAPVAPAPGDAAPVAPAPGGAPTAGPRPAGGQLPATGPAAGLPAVAALALLGAVVLRRRTARG